MTQPEQTRRARALVLVRRCCSRAVRSGPTSTGRPRPGRRLHAATTLPATADRACKAARRSISMPGGDCPANGGRCSTRVRYDLIEQALRANPDIDAAQAALRQAQENVYAGKGALFPTASANVQAGARAAFRRRVRRAEPEHVTFSLVTAQLNMSYAPDVFGGTRRQIESLAAQAEYQRFELEATYLTLTSNVVVAAVNEASLRGQIAATQRDHQGRDRPARPGAPAVRARRRIAGRRAAQQATLAQSRATLPPLRKAAGADSATSLPRWLGGFPNQELGAQLRSCRPAPADRSAAQPAVAAGRAAPRRARGGGAVSRRQRQSRRRHREPTAAVQHHRPRSAPRRWASPTCSRRHRRVEHRRRRQRRRCSTPARCCTRSAPRSAALGAGGGAIPQHGDQGVPERRRCAARAAIGRRRAARAGGSGTSGAPTAWHWRACNTRPARSAICTLLNADRTWQQARHLAGAGRGRPLRRHRRAVPGAGRRLVASQRRCRRRKRPRIT